MGAEDYLFNRWNTCYETCRNGYLIIRRSVVEFGYGAGKARAYGSLSPLNFPSSGNQIV
jgi:hypothetical protein